MSALWAELTSSERAALIEWIGRLKHDLGKYITMSQRWLEPDASISERREALIQDVTETRRGPDGTQTAVEVWGSFRAVYEGSEALPGSRARSLRGLTYLQELATTMHELSEWMPQLTVDAGADVVEHGAALTQRVARCCRELAREAKEAR